MLIRIILFPFTLVYSLIVRFRNHLYNIDYSRAFKFEIPVIVVGNLSAGGSGKTPVIEYLVGLLKHEYKPAILSRGYKRKTDGFRIAEEDDTASTIGDEPKQYYEKWKGTVPVVVGEDRVEAIPKILFERPDTNIILMDDGFQHRAVTPYLALLLTTHSRPFYNDHLLPGGRLREPAKEAKRADVIIVTKCPEDLEDNEQVIIKSKILQYSTKNVPIFFSSIRHSVPIRVFGNLKDFKKIYRDVILLTGIADPTSLEEYVRANWNLIEHLVFPDHQIYTDKILGKIYDLFLQHKRDGLAILTTEKDAMRLKDPDTKGLLKNMPLFYIPIKVVFLKGGAEFDNLILQRIKSF